MASDDSNLIWWIIGIILVLLWLGGSSEPSYDNCYDADPTQWTDMVCDY